MDIRNKKLSDDEFYGIRKEVMEQWPTGKEVNFEEAVDYHKAMPESKSFSRKLANAKKERKTLIQPRAGVALIDEHIKLLQYLQDKGEADLLPTTIDSYTRQNRYEEAEVGIKESIHTQKSMLNGFPAVNHGVFGCRSIIENLDTPVQVRHGTPDARLLTEICYAGGFTIYDWMYVDRLTGIYEEAGVSINREPYGPLTGTLVPPSMSNAVAIIEAMLAAEQGVKNVTVGYGQCGNLVQDVAALRVLEELTEEYLDKYGYEDVTVTSVLHQWMGGFPQDESKAFAVISWGSSVAALAKATKVIVKTPHEAMGVPTMEANAQGLRCTKQAISLLADQELKSSALELEKAIIKGETCAIVDKCFELGMGDLALGAIRGVKAGVLDIPFAPSKYNAGKMLPARDFEGAVRYLNVANVPLPRELKDFNQGKIEHRAKMEKRKASFQMVIDDVYAISKGRLVGKPK